MLFQPESVAFQKPVSKREAPDYYDGGFIKRNIKRANSMGSYQKANGPHHCVAECQSEEIQEQG